MGTGIVWFRRDLRLRDNPALDAATRTHECVLCVYIHAPDEEKPWQPGAASRWWLHHSLTALDADLRTRGAKLHIAAGGSATVLASLIEKTNADAIYWNRLYEPACAKRDEVVEQTLRERGVDVNVSNAALWREPWLLKNKQGDPYKVFTPFWRSLREQINPQPPLPTPRKIAAARVADDLDIAALRLLPDIAWDASFHTHWRPGERGAHARLNKFLSRGIVKYREGRDFPAQEFTSSLSPHLHFGEIGPRQIAWQIAKSHRTAAGEAFLRELGWREFSHHLLHHFPKTTEHNLNPQFDKFPWARRNAKTMARWQRGQTGIPIVDAGMRQLWQTGWMHNRVRMLVASFLTKNLRQHWLEGARWFWDTLVDADLANNTQGWQWTAGSGADAAPYFRIFNPVTQGKRFDPDGAYVKRWVPELKDLPPKWIHEPWLAKDLSGALAYPEPMVDLAESRASALAAFKKMRKENR